MSLPRLEAAEEMQLAPRQLAQFLAQHCGVTLGRFPVQRLRQSPTMGELGREKPQLKEVAGQLAQEVDTWAWMVAVTCGRMLDSR